MRILHPDRGRHPRARRGVAGRRQRPRRLPARGARPVQADEGPRRAALLRRAEGLPRQPSRRSTTGSSGWAWPTGPTRRSRRCPRAWPRRCSSSPPSSPGRSWCCSTSRSAASTRSTPRCCARRSSSCSSDGHDGHLLDARHGRRREDVRLHLHDLQGQQGARRHAGGDPGRLRQRHACACAWTATAPRWTACPAWPR